MIRPIAIVFALTFLIGPATGMPSVIDPAVSTHEEVLEVRLTKSNACKSKYKHKKTAQNIREKAHCN
jgi:hypothetical protein